MSKQVLIFGDSISLGFWDKEGGWVTRLRRFIDEQNLVRDDYYCVVYNLAIDGNTTENLLERMEFEIKQRLIEDETVIIVGVGGNDSCLVRSKNTEWVPINEFKKNIISLINIAKNFTPKLFFVGLTLVDESKTNPIPWSRSGKSYNNLNMRQYNEIIKTTCLVQGINFIEVMDEFENNPIELLEDGLHPNTNGHEKMFEIIKDELVKNKII